MQYLINFAAAILLLFSLPAYSATFLDGHTITTAFYFPDQNTIGFGGEPIQSLVGPGVEISGSPQGFPIASINFSDTAITLTFTENLIGSVAPFNGWRFYDADGTLPAFANASMKTNNTSGWFIFFDSDNIWLNGSGAEFFDASTVTIEVSPVPESATTWMLAFGLGIVAVVTKRSRQQLRKA